MHVTGHVTRLFSNVAMETIAPLATHSESVDGAYLLSDGEDIQESLGGVLPHPIPCVDEGASRHTAGSLRGGEGGILFYCTTRTHTHHSMREALTCAAPGSG